MQQPQTYVRTVSLIEIAARRLNASIEAQEAQKEAEFYAQLKNDQEKLKANKEMLKKIIKINKKASWGKKDEPSFDTLSPESAEELLEALKKFKQALQEAKS